MQCCNGYNTQNFSKVQSCFVCRLIPNGKCTMLRCPLCNESTVDQSVTWGQFDAEVANNPLPPALQGLRSRILCRECRKEQTVPYHFLALKCGDPSCASYNTQFLDMVSNDAVVQS